MASEEERRSKILNDYCELRRTHPELPVQLRDFQVKANVAENCTFENQQVDILCSALDETNSSHIMVALPTTCVSAFVEILQSLQCKILQYSFLGQYISRFLFPVSD